MFLSLCSKSEFRVLLGCLKRDQGTVLAGSIDTHRLLGLVMTWLFEYEKAFRLGKVGFGKRMGLQVLRARTSLQTPQVTGSKKVAMLKNMGMPLVDCSGLLWKHSRWHHCLI